MRSVTSFVLRHRLLVLGAWLIVTIAGAFATQPAVNRMTHTLATPGTPGFDTNAAILRRFGVDGNEQPTLLTLTLPPGETMGTATGQADAARTFSAAEAAGPVAVADYANTGNPKLVGPDGRTTWALINMPNPDTAAGQGVMERIPALVETAAPPGARVGVTGFEQIQTGGGGQGPSPLIETLIGMAGALLILLTVFGSAVAVVPVVIAVPAILVSFLMVWALTGITDISFLVEFLVALIGLGVSIDYSLLIVTRWREERTGGVSNRDAVLASLATAGKSVIVSGLTVAIGLLSLVVLPVPFLRSVGYGGMLIPIVSVAAALTLLPITLVAFGPALDRHRFHKAGFMSRRWARWGQIIVRRRRLAAVAGAAIVVALALPALSINVGQPHTTAFPKSTAAYRTLAALETDGVPSAVVFPIQVLTHGGPVAAARIAAVADATAGVYTALAPTSPSFQQGSDALVSVIPTHEGDTAAGRATVDQLRSRLGSIPGGAMVGGNTAQNKDFASAVYGNFPLMLTVIGIVTFVLLSITLRSAVLALKAVVLNVISLGASYGFLVVFWQHGHGSRLLYGVPPTGSISVFVPVIVFAFLYGLSMDYEVFLLARMREEYDRSGSTESAIVSGLGHTGRLVTSGAMILAVSFLSLSTNPDLPVRLIATGLAFGILLDAVIVRTILVPALVALMGRWNWWLPSPLLSRLQRAPA